MLRRCLIAIVLLASIPALAQKRPSLLRHDELKRVGDSRLTDSAGPLSLPSMSRSTKTPRSRISGSFHSPVARPAVSPSPVRAPKTALAFADGAQLLYTCFRGGSSQLYVQPFQSATGTLAATRASSPASPRKPMAPSGLPTASNPFLSSVWPTAPTMPATGPRTTTPKNQDQGQGLRPPALPSLERL